MLKSERRNELFEYLADNGFTTVKVLSEKLYTSESSIRRDLTELEKMGLVKRSYGGARAITASTNVLPFRTRSYSAVTEKRLIASKAAKLIRDGDTVFLDQSSTSYFLATELVGRAPLTVVTNNLEILALLSGTEHTVICSGGTVSRRNTNCLIGKAAEDTFLGIFADILFFSAKALDGDGVISDCTREEIYVRDAMLKQARTKVFLCDSGKLGSRSVYKQCTIADVDIFVTDLSPERVGAKYPDVKIV